MTPKECKASGIWSAAPRMYAILPIPSVDTRPKWTAA
jgi:hypothetical protein